eukprot:SAG31_NODE_3902_length_3768_cov_5.032979_4_plen_160_part_00
MFGCLLRMCSQEWGLKALKAVAAARSAPAAPAQPFFIGVGFHKPHMPEYCPVEYYDMYDPTDIRLPENPWAPQAAPEIAVQVRVVTFSFLCPLLEKYWTFIARCNALIEKVSPCTDLQAVEELDERDEGSAQLQQQFQLVELDQLRSIRQRQPTDALGM